MQATSCNAWSDVSLSRGQPNTGGWSQPLRDNMTTEQRKSWLQHVSKNAIYICLYKHG
jgi:hypothetical protein